MPSETPNGSIRRLIEGLAVVLIGGSITLGAYTVRSLFGVESKVREQDVKIMSIERSLEKAAITNDKVYDLLRGIDSRIGGIESRVIRIETQIQQNRREQ